MSEYAWGSQPTASMEYAKHGMSRSRIRDAIRSCKCKIPGKLLLRLCVLLWMLSKQKQDAVRWGIQHESGPQKKKTWHLAGPCVECICRLLHCFLCAGMQSMQRCVGDLLGVGKHRLMRCKNTFRGKGMRSQRAKAVPCFKSLIHPQSLMAQRDRVTVIRYQASFMSEDN